MKMNKDNLENIKDLIVKVTPVVTIAASLLSMWSSNYSRNKIISEEVSKQFDEFIDGLVEGDWKWRIKRVLNKGSFVLYLEKEKFYEE